MPPIASEAAAIDGGEVRREVRERSVRLVGQEPK
jgi:hypothetical protein